VGSSRCDGQALRSRVQLPWKMLGKKLILCALNVCANLCEKFTVSCKRSSQLAQLLTTE
jgi:hypothetical protein